MKSIDQVFNGIGYIGSTVWVDKGVKGLIPNGRNEDGTLNNIEFVTDNVLIYNEFNNNTASYASINYDNGNLNLVRSQMSSTSYNSAYNYIYRKDGLFPNSVIVANVTASSSGITSFEHKQPFRAVDYNEATGLAMPSDRYIDLELGATGTVYTAPADGYVTLVKVAGKTLTYIQAYVVSTTLSTSTFPASATNWGYITLPVRKGQKFGVAYTSTGETKYFRFIYAQGAQ